MSNRRWSPHHNGGMYPPLWTAKEILFECIIDIYALLFLTIGLYEHTHPLGLLYLLIPIGNAYRIVYLAHLIHRIEDLANLITKGK